MKKLILIFLMGVSSFQFSTAQITTAQHKAAFGVDGELRSAILVNTNQFASVSHDWFNYNGASNPTFGVPRFIIDTSGAASITSRYVWDANFRRLPFFRVMRQAPFTVLDGKLLIDGVYIRDYHGNDSTVFAMSNKNGDNPGSWTGANESNIPDKNDILDMYVHVRRAGSQSRLADSLWFIGGIALDATNGNRYFDFEMYQTDIFYNRATQKFTGFGPDEGHTSWQFDPITHAVTIPGDVIFSAEFSGGGLQNLQARIWVHKDALNYPSPNFIWGGAFNGGGTNYGYANILPQNGSNFYSGLQNASATWAGPYQLVRANNSVQTTFDANQFLEFSVNMGQLGLDPISLLGGSACGLPFRRILVKTRSSSSFSSELKDFVGPFDFFKFATVDAAADIPFICGDNMISTISVINPIPTSTYTWETLDGNILSDPNSTEITVDTGGTYIVKQQLLAECGAYSIDTVVVLQTSICGILPQNRIQLNGTLEGEEAKLEFTVSANENVDFYVLERSFDGKSFETVKILNSSRIHGSDHYLTSDKLRDFPGEKVYYRVKIVRVDNSVRYSSSIQLKREMSNEGIFFIMPNPVKDKMQLVVQNSEGKEAIVRIFNIAGALLEMKKITLNKGNNVIDFGGFEKWSSGIYPVQMQVNGRIYTNKMVVTGKKSR